MISLAIHSPNDAKLLIKMGEALKELTGLKVWAYNLYGNMPENGERDAGVSGRMNQKNTA